MKDNKNHKGITWDAKRNKWYTRIMFAKVRYAIGRFDTQQEAIAAYQAAQEMGVVKFKAWYSKDPAHRGSLFDTAATSSTFIEEENKIKSFSFLKDSNEEEKSLLSW